MSEDAPEKLRVIMSSLERRGPWAVPQTLDLRVLWSSVELDLREAVLVPGLTTINLEATMGNVEVIVPPGLGCEVAVTVVGGNIEQPPEGTRADPAMPRLRIVGKLKLANLEIIEARSGESRRETHRRRRREHHHTRHAEHRRRWHAMHAEREMWLRSRPHRMSWRPWWLMARMRRRIFSWFTIAFAAGIAVGVYAWNDPRWWHVVLALFGLFATSGAVAWRLTRPLLMVVGAAQDIGDGKLDKRLDVHHHGGETRLLAEAINDMAARIERQLKDQRELLAAVSHELRTPLGHMRVLIETARDTGDLSTLEGLDREVLVLDDLVGRLLAQSRLEFGNLDRRPLDLGELVSDVATTSGVAPEAIEAIGDVRAAIDPTLIRRAVANLVDNARVHGGGAVAVRIERRAGQVAVEVDDAGPGVAADRRADAFRAFVPSSGGGLGLGLALVSRIAVAHGGGAWIDDRPGGGARVGFSVEVTAG